MNYYARLLDGECSAQTSGGLMAKATDDNLLTYSRGGRCRSVAEYLRDRWQYRRCGGVAEMLLQSQGGAIHLLPALPAAWPDGQSVGFAPAADFRSRFWRSGALFNAVIRSNL